MNYLYGQQPIPTNATGVHVSLDVVDANNNFRHIGDATSDVTGHYSFQYTPDIAGKYTVIASFPGSNSYYASSDETSIAVDLAATHAPTTTAASEQSMADQFFIPAIAGLFVAIIAIGVVLALLVLRKK